MHYSGVVISAAMDRFAACTRILEDIPGVEVHLQYPEQGKIVVVLETPTVDEQEALFRRVRAVPEVLSAELTYHYAESPDDPLPRREP